MRFAVLPMVMQFASVRLDILEAQAPRVADPNASSVRIVRETELASIPDASILVPGYVDTRLSVR